MKYFPNLLVIVSLTILSCTFSNRNRILSSNKKVLDVRELGVFPNETIDRTALVQKAFNHGSSNNIALYFPNGKYKIGQKLNFPSNLEIVGEDRKKTVFFRGEQMNENWTYARNAQNITLRNIGFDGNEAKQPQKAYSTTLRFDECTNIIIDNCYFTATGERGTDFRACKNVLIENSYFYKCGTNNPDGNEGNAISVDVLNQNKSTDLFSKNIKVINCRFEQFGDTAIGCPQGDGIEIIGNKIYGKEYFGEKPLKFECGISLNGATNCVVKNNELLYLNDFGIACISRGFGETPWVSSNINIIGNHIEHANKPIRVEGRPKEKLYADNIVIADNTMKNCKGSLWFRYFVKNSKIENNTFIDFGIARRKKFFESHATIRLYDTKEIVVKNNKFIKKKNAESGMSHCIYINGTMSSDTKIEANIFEDYKKTKVGIASNVSKEEMLQLKNGIK